MRDVETRRGGYLGTWPQRQICINTEDDTGQGITSSPLCFQCKRTVLTNQTYNEIPSKLNYLSSWSPLRDTQQRSVKKCFIKK